MVFGHNAEITKKIGKKMNNNIDRGYVVFLTAALQNIPHIFHDEKAL